MKQPNQQSSINGRVPSAEPRFPSSCAQSRVCGDESFQGATGDPPFPNAKSSTSKKKEKCPRRAKLQKAFAVPASAWTPPARARFDVQINALTRLPVHTSVCLPHSGALFSDKTFIPHARTCARGASWSPPPPTPTRRKVSGSFDAGPHRSALLL